MNQDDESRLIEQHPLHDLCDSELVTPLGTREQVTFFLIVGIAAICMIWGLIQLMIAIGHAVIWLLTR